MTDDERLSRLPLAESKDDAYRLPNTRFEAPPIPFGGGAANCHTTVIPNAMPLLFDVSARRRSSRGDTTKKPIYIDESDESDADDKEDEGGKENQVKHTPNSPAKHTANSLYTLGNSSEEEDYAVEDSQDY